MNDLALFAGPRLRGANGERPSSLEKHQYASQRTGDEGDYYLEQSQQTNTQWVEISFINTYFNMWR